MDSNLQKQLSDNYITEFTQLVPAGSVVNTPFGTVRHSRGKVSSVSINTREGVIDFSQGVDGSSEAGKLTTLHEPGHDDERDDPFYVAESYPRHEGDIQFLKEVAESIRNSHQNAA